MARQHGIIRFEGKLEGFSFYRTKDGYIVRKSGGFKSDRLKNDACYAPCRKTAADFGACSKASKILKEALGDFLPPGNGKDMHLKRKELFTEIQKLDTAHPVGHRHPAHVIHTTEAKALIKGFDLVPGHTFARFLTGHRLSVDGSVGFDSKLTTLILPKAATHACVQSAWVRVDLYNDVHDTRCSPPVFVRNSTELKNIVLEPGGVPEGDGVDLYLLKVCFFEEVNGEMYEVRGSAVVILE